ARLLFLAFGPRTTRPGGERQREDLLARALPIPPGSFVSCSPLLGFVDIPMRGPGSLGPRRQRTGFYPHARGPVFLQADPLSGGSREINDPPLGMRPPISNLDLHDLAGLQVRDLCRCPQRQCPVSGRELTLVEAFPARRFFTLL